MRGGVLLTLLAIAGCGGGGGSSHGGGSLPPQDADKGDPAATKAVRVEAVRAWLDPDQTKKYDNTVAIVVRNTSDKLATGVTAVARWPNAYNTSQQNGIAIPPGESGIFLLGPFKPDPPVTGDPKAEVRADKLKPAPKQEAIVKFSGIKQSGKCAATGTVSNKFTHNHPGTSGLIAGLKNGKIVTAGSIFFEEPGLVPGKTTTFKADLAPLCPSEKPDEWVAYAQLGEPELAKP
jgi:hypothetical protein